MTIGLLVLLVASSAGAPGPGALPDVYYVARAGVTHIADIERVLEDPQVAGVTLYVGWASLEPLPVKLNWPVIDKVFELAREHRKIVNLAVSGGRWTPDWVYSKGAAEFDYTETVSLRGSTHKKWRSVRPWDAVYLTEFGKMVALLGDRYRTESHLGYVAVTGPSPDNGLETHLAVSDPGDFERLGFEAGAFVNAWARMLDVYQLAFPNARLAIALHLLIGPPRAKLPQLLPETERVDVPLKIRELAEARSGGRINFMLMGLDRDLMQKTLYLSLIRGTPGSRLGLQAIRIFSTPGARYAWGPFCEELARVGKSLNPKWIELWIEDYESFKSGPCSR